MRIGRTLPPAAAPLSWGDLCHGVAGLCAPAQSTRRLEASIRRRFRVRHVFLLSSGKAALTLTLAALRASSPRTDVVIPAYTCYSVPAAVLKAGLRPVLCDIDPTTFDFDHALLERALGPHTLCIVGHHLFGIASDMERLRRLCRRHGLYLVEDAAQAMGVESGGRKLGTLGDAGIFSLGRGKHMTCGSGGIIVTDSTDIAAAIETRYRQIPGPRPARTVRDLAAAALMRVFIHPRLYWIPAALPFLRLGETIFPRDFAVARLSGTKAGLLHDWNARLTHANASRSSTAAYYGERLQVALPSGRAHPYLRFPILASSGSERSRLHAWSRTHGLGLGAGYPTAVNEIPEIRDRFDGQAFPAARAVAERLVTLPTHHWLSARDRESIADAVIAATGAARPTAPLLQAS